MSAPKQSVNWYNRVLACQFERPEELPLDYFFYLGVPDQGQWDTFGTHETNYLVGQGFKTEMGVQKMPRANLDEILQEYFGCSVSDVVIPENWLYYDETDSYYSNRNDSYTIRMFEITAITEETDGIVRIDYTVTQYYRNTETGEFLNNPQLTMTLKINDDGNYAVLSNMLAE